MLGTINLLQDAFSPHMIGHTVTTVVDFSKSAGLLYQETNEPALLG